MMTRIMKVVLGSMLSVMLFTACGGGGTNFDDPVKDESYSSGDVDLSRYVALGDSLTAGYKDGTLYIDGQLDSFPNILAQLFAEVDGGSFIQPLMADNLGGLLLSGNPISSAPARRVLAINPNYDPTNPRSSQFLPVIQSGSSTTDVTAPLSPPFNNYGVPGAKSFHLLAPSYGELAGLFATPTPTANPYAVYFGYAANAMTHITAEAAAQAPTFFTLWIGNNDVLDYATGGGVGADSSTTPAYGTQPGDITDPVNVFAPTYNTIVANLIAGGAKGVLVNIPSIVDIPFFTTVPYDSIRFTDADATSIALANGAYAAYNAGLDVAVTNIGNPAIFSQADADSRKISFSVGQNPIVIEDETLFDLTGSGLPNYRPATPNDFILLTTSSLLGTLRIPGDLTSVIGVGSPLQDSEVLLPSEAAEIETARDAYNATIEAAASANPDLIFYDAAAVLADLNDGNGISFGTGTVDSTFATGGAFSLDGVHPTARGYAIIANGIIDAMNAGFTGADLPRTDPGTYSEVFFEFPAGFDFSP